MTNTERPILFSGPMVRAILDDSKTQTRRVLNRNKLYNGFAFDDPRIARACPYGQLGDRLWVRETWQINHVLYDRGSIPKIHPVEFGEPVDMLYRADGEFSEQFEIDEGGSGWRPSIFMPRWASRILLEVLSVKVERVQDITPNDCMHEGITAPLLIGYTTMRDGFAQLWDQINGKRGYPWSINPWVWVVEFKRLV